MGKGFKQQTDTMRDRAHRPQVDHGWMPVEAQRGSQSMNVATRRGPAPARADAIRHVDDAPGSHPLPCDTPLEKACVDAHAAAERRQAILPPAYRSALPGAPEAVRFRLVVITVDIQAAVPACDKRRDAVGRLRLGNMKHIRPNFERVRGERRRTAKDDADELEGTEIPPPAGVAIDMHLPHVGDVHAVDPEAPRAHAIIGWMQQCEVRFVAATRQLPGDRQPAAARRSVVEA